MTIDRRPSIAFLAVARASDGAVLASRFDLHTSGGERADLEFALAALLQRAKRLGCPGWRAAEPAGVDGSAVHALTDVRGLAVLAVGVRRTDYPERTAQQLLRALAEQLRSSLGDEVLLAAGAGGLSATLRRQLQGLMRAYDDPAAVDELAQVQEKVEDLKCVMQDNVRQIIESHASIAALQNSSQSMTAAADKFVKQSVTLKRQVQWRNLKVKALVIGFFCLLLLYLSLPFVT